jgi:hypothetical protein
MDRKRNRISLSVKQKLELLEKIRIQRISSILGNFTYEGV